MNDRTSLAGMPSPSLDGERTRRGSGPVRVLVLGVDGALLIGSAGFVVSVAMDPQSGLPQTMCVDSSCTYAMSADMSMSQSSMARPRPQPHHASAPERLVRDLLSVVHIH